MSDLPATEPVIAIIAKARTRPAKAPLDLVKAPILSTLLRLAIPNTVARRKLMALGFCISASSTSTLSFA